MLVVGCGCLLLFVVCCLSFVVVAVVVVVVAAAAVAGGVVVVVVLLNWFLADRCVHFRFLKYIYPSISLGVCF